MRPETWLSNNMDRSSHTVIQYERYVSTRPAPLAQVCLWGQPPHLRERGCGCLQRSCPEHKASNSRSSLLPQQCGDAVALVHVRVQPVLLQIQHWRTAECHCASPTLKLINNVP